MAPLPPNPDPLLNQPITEALIAKHGLLPEEYKLIQSVLGRDPNLTELGIFSVMWSEHCSYKNSRKLLKLFPTEKVHPGVDGVGRVLVKAGEENAGIIDIGEGWAIAFKIESHNHPSAVEPFEGAATGVGGIIRDIFTMGARPVLLTNSLRFGELSEPQVQRLFRGVVSGIAHYGNCIGIPNLGGDVTFDPSYEGNPLVNALCLGILRHDQIQRGAARGVGNPVYYVGAPTGRDGLGGASFASRELTEESQADRPAVQKGDPFMEKLLLEACLEMMAVPGLVVGIQDMGAAGLTCSSCETASRGGSGIEIDLHLVPQREVGMNSYEIMLSESQERMLVIVQKGREAEIESIFAKWDLHASRIGLVTDTGHMVVRQGAVVVADIPANSLTDSAPLYSRESRRPGYLNEVQAWTPASLPALEPAGIREVLETLLGHPTLASKEWIYRQYDHMVMAGTVLPPGASSGVIQLPVPGKTLRVAIANDANGRYCWLDPYEGARQAVAECVRNLACTGARALGMTDNLNFGNPYKPEVFYMLEQCVHGLADACRHFDLPVVGGNVSLYNENPDGAIDPTPVVSVAGLVPESGRVAERACSAGNEILFLLGNWPTELGGSQYLKLCHGLKTGPVPKVDLDRESLQNEFVIQAIASGWMTAANDIAEGGLLVAICEMLFGMETLGAALNFSGPGMPDRMDALFFGESQGRILLAAKPEHADELLEKARGENLSLFRIGNIMTDPVLSISTAFWNDVVKLSVPELRKIWSTAIPSRMDRNG